MRAANLVANCETTEVVCVVTVGASCSRPVWSRLAANLGLVGRLWRAIGTGAEHFQLASSKYWRFL